MDWADAYTRGLDVMHRHAESLAKLTPADTDPAATAALNAARALALGMPDDSPGSRTAPQSLPR